MGGFIADNRKIVSMSKCIYGFLISFILMFIEATVLHNLNLQRHDSMYTFLLPVTFFLFNFDRLNKELFLLLFTIFIIKSIDTIVIDIILITKVNILSALGDEVISTIFLPVRDFIDNTCPELKFRTFSPFTLT